MDVGLWLEGKSGNERSKAKTLTVPLLFNVFVVAGGRPRRS
jgi:hypothetical protein